MELNRERTWEVILVIVFTLSFSISFCSSALYEPRIFSLYVHPAHSFCVSDEYQFPNSLVQFEQARQSMRQKIDWKSVLHFGKRLVHNDEMIG